MDLIVATIYIKLGVVVVITV